MSETIAHGDQEVKDQEVNLTKLNTILDTGYIPFLVRLQLHGDVQTRWLQIIRTWYYQQITWHSIVLSQQQLNLSLFIAKTRQSGCASHAPLPNLRPIFQHILFSLPPTIWFDQIMSLVQDMIDYNALAQVLDLVLNQQPLTLARQCLEYMKAHAFETPQLPKLDIPYNPFLTEQDVTLLSVFRRNLTTFLLDFQKQLPKTYQQLPQSTPRFSYEKEKQNRQRWDTFRTLCRKIKQQTCKIDLNRILQQCQSIPSLSMNDLLVESDDTISLWDPAFSTSKAKGVVAATGDLEDVEMKVPTFGTPRNE